MSELTSRTKDEDDAFRARAWQRSASRCSHERRGCHWAETHYNPPTWPQRDNRVTVIRSAFDKNEVSFIITQAPHPQTPTSRTSPEIDTASNKSRRKSRRSKSTSKALVLNQYSSHVYMVLLSVGCRASVSHDIVIDSRNFLSIAFHFNIIKLGYSKK